MKTPSHINFLLLGLILFLGYKLTYAYIEKESKRAVRINESFLHLSPRGQACPL